MFSRFLIDTLDLILAILDRLGLIQGNRAWHRERILRRVRDVFGRREVPEVDPNTRHATCPQCRAFISRSETTCPRCGTDVVAARRGAGSAIGALLRPSLGSVSTTLTGAIVTVYVASAVASGGLSAVLALPGEMLYRLGALVPFMYDDFAWWRLVCAIFLHGGLTHILFNAYALSTLGPRVEADIGGRRFLVVFMATGIISFFGSAFVGRGISVGASGPLFGLIGFGLAYGHLTGDRMLRADMARWALLGFLMMPLLGFVLGLRVDHAAHAAGFVAGLPFGVVVRGPKARSPRLIEAGWTALALIAGLLPLLCFAIAMSRAMAEK